MSITVPVNPTKITHPGGPNWVRFAIVPSQGRRFSAGFYTMHDAIHTRRFPKELKKLLKEFEKMLEIQRFHIHIDDSGTSGYIAVKFKDHVIPGSSLVNEVADKISLRLK